jgi:signal transduction histidine kinase
VTSPRRSPSILQRILWLHVLALAAITVAVSAAAYLLLNSTVNDFEERLLRDHAAGVESHLFLVEGRWTLRLPPDLASLYGRGLGGYALAVTGDDGSVIYSSLPNEKPFISTDSRPARPQFFHQGRGDSIYYGVTLPVHQEGRAAWIQVGQNLQNPDVIVDDVVALFLGRITWFVLPIYVVLLLLDVFLMRRLMAPIIAASRVASSITPTRPLTRLPTGNLPREVLPLANAVNQAFDRLEKGIQAQREFTADAAHELRTPLAILRTHVDTMLDASAAKALQNDLDGMSRVLDQLLELAELEHAGATPELLDLNELGSDVVALMAPLALAEQKSLELVASPARPLVLGNRDMLFSALRNLVENAIRHSKARQSVEVEVAIPAAIRVKDRGPGIQAQDRELVFRRFWRRNRQDKGHAGLGLAIVAKIAQLHGGSVEVTEREGGGAEFTIRFAGLSNAP